MQKKRVFFKNTPARVFQRLNLGNVAGVSCVCLLATTAPIAAQVAPIVPDATLPNNSIVTQSGSRVTIDGGTSAGGNLFHSFEEFSVPSGGEAFFNNALTVENIIARVTGMGLTNIDGILGANGSANLFLLNPNGIVFGADAALNLGGSFFATTADRLFWEDGSEFSATNPGTPPLLTINGPIGFELGANPGNIVNQSRAIATGLDGSETVAGLQVGRGETIALVGGNINLEAGNLSAPEGRIELASIRDSELRREGAGFSAASSEFLAGDIQLSQASIVDASGEGGGDIQVQSRRISVKDGSQIQSTTIGGQPGGVVTVRAAELVEVEGNSPSELPPSGIVNQTIGTGTAGDVTIETGRLIVRDGIISASTLGSGNGGNLAVRASDSVEVSAGLTDGFPRGLVNVSLGAGNSGNLTVETGRLVVRDGAFVASGTRGSGNGGNLTIRATDSVEAIGTSPDGLSFTAIQSAATQGSEEIQMRFGSSVVTGNAGNLTIETARLIVRDGATVSTSTEGSGTGGNLTVRASESIETSGVSGDGRFPSGLLGDTSGSGAGGDLTLETGRLFLEDGAQVSARTFGAGSGGNITVNASESVELVGTSFEGFQMAAGAALSGLLELSELPGGIGTGSAGTGSSGDIAIATPELILRNGGLISTASFGDGAAGNLTVTASERVEAIASGFLNASLAGSGAAGSLSIKTRFLSIRDGSSILAGTLGTGAGANVTVEASEQMEILSTPAGALIPTGIFTNSAGGTGPAGNITINTPKLVLRDGGQAVTSSGATIRGRIIPIGGPGGNLTVNAADSVEISGVAADGRVTSALVTTTFSGSRAGSISVSTRQLTIRDGAGIFAATEEAGRGGTLNLQVSEKVELIGTSDIGTFRRSGLFATSGSDFFPIEASGQGGDLRLATGELIVRDGAIVSVNSVESGAAGTLEVVADSIALENSGAIDATTISGSGGNISLIAREIQLRGTSQITTDAGNTDGGNITISTQTLAALENSDITANAQQGRGGRVNIDATGIFGTAFRAAPTPRSDITATSNLGPQFSGVVEINAPDIDASAGLAILEGEALDVAGLVVRDVCANAGAGSEFVVTGRGGLPPNPNEPLTTDTVWRDERFLVGDSPTQSPDEREPMLGRDEGKHNSQESAIRNQPFVEAQGWIVSPEGDIILVADPPKVTPNGPALTPPTCRQQL
ncbi:MAG: filamentous hemagglutinin N-terminal domain-containing protein [Oscillatoria sp. SIO1A7]|nr:filamentous hemagglutinin N-terminal domain-containing protein [Oscillatoria sp. SIO1A7]